jgi:hypothetical protein
VAGQERLLSRCTAHTVLVRLALVSGAVLVANTATFAVAQNASDLKARCDQLFAFYDWYGASRSENTDGARNQERIRAGVACGSGNYDEGVALMEDLLRRKNFDVLPPTSFAQVPGPPRSPVQ